MRVADSAGTPLRADLITSTVLRTDMTPIPATVEIEALSTRETAAVLQEGATVRVGEQGDEFLIVKTTGEKDSGVSRGGRELASIGAIGVLASCEAVGRRLQRSIIREGATFAEIYRSIGSTAIVASDFAVPLFGCFIGFLPTPHIAQVLQEEGATMFYAGGRLHFRRIGELMAEAAAVEYPVDQTKEVRSDYLDRHAVPFAFTTNADNTFLDSKREAARGITYRPRADLRTLNNISSALVVRRKMRDTLAPGFNAGTRVNIAGKPHVVVTALHVQRQGERGGEEYTQLWLGEYVQ